MALTCGGSGPAYLIGSGHWARNLLEGDEDGSDVVAKALQQALDSARLDTGCVRQVFVASREGLPTDGILRAGLQDLPVFTVATSALTLAKSRVETGDCECVVAVVHGQAAEWTERANKLNMPVRIDSYLLSTSRMSADNQAVPEEKFLYAAAAVVLASDIFVHEHGLQAQAVEVVGQQTVEGISRDSVRRAMLSLMCPTVRESNVDTKELQRYFRTNHIIAYDVLSHSDRKCQVKVHGKIPPLAYAAGGGDLNQCVHMFEHLHECARRGKEPVPKLAVQVDLVTSAVLVGLYRLAYPDYSRESVEYLVYGSPSVDPQNFRCYRLLSHAVDNLNADGNQVTGSVCLKVKGANDAVGVWHLLVVDGRAHLSFLPDLTEDADCILDVSDSDLVRLMTGKLSLDKAYLQKRARIQGDLNVPIKLLRLRPVHSKL